MSLVCSPLYQEYPFSAALHAALGVVLILVALPGGYLIGFTWWVVFCRLVSGRTWILFILVFFGTDSGGVLLSLSLRRCVFLRVICRLHCLPASVCV